MQLCLFYSDVTESEVRKQDRFQNFSAETMKWCLPECHRWLGQENLRKTFILKLILRA